MDEYSDSEDEGDDRKNEKSYRDTKRPRLVEETSKNGAPRSSATSRGQLISSPLPPEPSPITPLAQDDGDAEVIKSKSVILYTIFIAYRKCGYCIIIVNLLLACVLLKNSGPPITVVY